MNVDTGEFKAITGEVAALAEQVAELRARTDTTLRVAGLFYEAGRADALGQTPRVRSPRRRRHLKVVR